MKTEWICPTFIVRTRKLCNMSVDIQKVYRKLASSLGSGAVVNLLHEFFKSLIPHSLEMWVFLQKCSSWSCLSASSSLDGRSSFFFLALRTFPGMTGKAESPGRKIRINHKKDTNTSINSDLKSNSHQEGLLKERMMIDQKLDYLPNSLDNQYNAKQLSHPNKKNKVLSYNRQSSSHCSLGDVHHRRSCVEHCHPFLKDELTHLSQ